jgi:hypothetical protein
MSPRLAISAAISVLTMAIFALSSTTRAPEPFGRDAAKAEIRAEEPQSAHPSFGPVSELVR